MTQLLLFTLQKKQFMSKKKEHPKWAVDSNWDRTKFGTHKHDYPIEEIWISVIYGADFFNLMPRIGITFI